LLFRLERSRSGSESSARFLAFFAYDAVDRPGVAVPTVGKDDDANLLRRRRLAFLFGAAKYESSEFRVWKEGAVEPKEIEALEPWSPRREGDAGRREERDRQAARAVLEARAASPAGEGEEDLERAVGEFVRKHTETRKTRHVRVPFLFYYRSD